MPDNKNNPDKRYQLERKSKKHICPGCGKKRFVRYIDTETGEYLADDCGRCDREFSCGYHKTPHEYFAEHPEKRPDERKKPKMGNTTKKTNKFKTDMQKTQIAPESFTIQPERVTPTQTNPGNSTLAAFLNGLIEPLIVEGVLEEYGVGMTDKGATLYWYFDREGRCRGGKVITYTPDGHRSKDKTPYWEKPEGGELNLCLYGEHLLAKFPDAPVIIVESEKTCLVGRCLHSSFVWVATGGKQINLGSISKTLAGRKVLALPDSDAVQLWRKELGEDIAISEHFCEPGGTDDYADYVIKKLKMIQ